MSNWTDIRDGVLEQINADTISSKFKEELYNKIVRKIKNIISDTGEQLAKALEESAKTETSPWCKFRDSFVLPTSIRILVWIIKTALTIPKEQD